MNLNRLLCTFIIAISLSGLNAAHIVGGLMSYECMGVDTIQQTSRIMITASLFRDNQFGGAGFDQPAAFGVYRTMSFSDYEFVELYEIRYDPDLEVFKFQHPFIPSVTIEGQKADYKQILELPLNGYHYQIVYQRCCRQQDLSNILEPGETGFALQMMISYSGLMSCGQSPIQTDIPNLFYNQNYSPHELHFHYEGDKDISFELKSPLQSGGTFDASMGGTQNCCECVRPEPSICPPPYNDIIFTPPYSPNKPFGEGDYYLDETSGNIFGDILEVGKYSFAIEIIQQEGSEIHSRQLFDYVLYVTSQTSSIRNNYLNLSISLYPNPVQDVIYLKSENQIENIQIIDTQGKIVKTILKLNEEFNHSIIVRDLEPGNYTVIAESSSGVQSLKFIKIQ